MKHIESLRRGAMAFAFLTLVGGYFGHQWMLGTGPLALQEWGEAMYAPNLILGWLLLALCVVFALLREDQASALTSSRARDDKEAPRT